MNAILTREAMNAILTRSEYLLEAQHDKRLSVSSKGPLAGLKSLSSSTWICSLSHFLYVLLNYYIHQNTLRSNTGCTPYCPH